MIKAVIFDMDGVLVNSEPYHFDFEKNHLKEMGITITDRELENFVGISVENFWKTIRERYNVDETIERLVEQDTDLRVSYFSNIRNLESVDGVRELIVTLRDKGIKTAVASSSHIRLIETVLEKTGLAEYFDETVSGCDVENGKPAPDIFLRTAEILGEGTEDCVVIEDSFNGLKGTKAAGMKCIAFRNPESGNQDLSAADLVIDSFTETGEIFKFLGM